MKRFSSFTCVGFAAAGIWATLSAPALAVEKLVTVSECSLVPYELKLTMKDIQTDQVTVHTIDPGKCTDLRLSIGIEGALYSIAATPSASVSRLLDYPFFQNAWGGHPVFGTNGSGVRACVSQKTGDFEEVGWLGRCGSSEVLAELGFFAADEEQHFLFVDDPHVCKEASINCAEDEIGDLLAWSSSLARSLATSWRAQHPTYEHGLVPTETGLATSDSNGPLQRGIDIDYQVAEFTPFGSPIYAKGGDTIVTFNGEPVFDRDSFIILSIEHGIKAGYQNPYSMQIVRNGLVHNIEGYTAFHRGTFGSIFMDQGGACRVGTRAALSTALNEASFYTAPILGCAGYDLENMSVDRRATCEFAYKQLLAAYRQWCPEVSQYASIAGAIIMPGRKGAETAVRRFGVQRLGRLAAPLVVEAIEETARAVMTLPPGIKAADNINSIAQQIGFGMVVGQVVGQGIRVISVK